MERHPVYQALGQKHQIWGCDRELFMLNLLIGGVLVFLSHSLTIALLALITALVILLSLKRMGTYDLLLRHVYLRQLHYRRYYMAQARLSTINHKHYF